MGGFSVSLNIIKEIMKKYIAAILAVIVFTGTYYVTGSWKLSLIIPVIIIAYLAWLIGIELGLSDFKSKGDKSYRAKKKEHVEKTRDNPTLR